MGEIFSEDIGFDPKSQMLFVILNEKEIRWFVQAAGGADLDEGAHEVGPQDEHRGLQGEARQPPHPDHGTRLPQVWALR